MQFILDAVNWFQQNMEPIFTVVAYAIATASLLVKLTPTMKDDNILKGIIKFIGKYIALDKYGPKGE